MEKELIQELLEENQIYRDEIDRLKSSYNELCQTLNDVVKFMTQMEGRIQKNTKLNIKLYNRIQNLPYEIFDYRFQSKYDIPKIMTEEETIDEIVLHKKSIARFGDGEFGIMFGISRWRFQKNDKRLAERLREVVTSQDGNILIGINNFYGDLSHRTESDADGIRSYITPEIRAQHMVLFCKLNDATNITLNEAASV